MLKIETYGTKPIMARIRSGIDKLFNKSYLLMKEEYKLEVY